MEILKVPIDKIENSSAILSILELSEKNRLDKFQTKRIYWISNFTQGEERGHHAHKTLSQTFIAIRGHGEIRLTDGVNLEVLNLGERSGFGYKIGPGLWREISPLSSDFILLVLADQEYDENDYIRNFEDFLSYVQKQD